MSISRSQLDEIWSNDPIIRCHSDHERAIRYAINNYLTYGRVEGAIFGALVDNGDGLYITESGYYNPNWARRNRPHATVYRIEELFRPVPPTSHSAWSNP